MFLSKTFDIGDILDPLLNWFSVLVTSTLYYRKVTSELKSEAVKTCV